MQFFYDTCSLLSKGKEVFDTDKTFYISSITLKELENIKTSSTKDAETKYKARKLVNLLDEHEDQYQVIFYDKTWDQAIDNDPFLPNNDDSRIIISALHGPADSIIFITQDSLCKRFAKMKGLNVTYLSETDADDYKGYEIIKIESDDEMAKLYDTIFNLREVPIPLKCNEYLIIKDKDDSIIDKYVYRNGVLQQLKSFPCFQSKMFGKVKPKDSYQWLAMESLNHNKITMLRGVGGQIPLGLLFLPVPAHRGACTGGAELDVHIACIPAKDLAAVGEGLLRLGLHGLIDIFGIPDHEAGLGRVPVEYGDDVIADVLRLFRQLHVVAHAGQGRHGNAGAHQGAHHQQQTGRHRRSDPGQGPFSFLGRHGFFQQVVIDGVHQRTKLVAHR